MIECARAGRVAGGVVLVLTLSACGGGGGGGGTSPSPVPPTPAAPTVTAVTVTGAGCSAGVAAAPAAAVRGVCGAELAGATIQLAATASLSDGTTQTVTTSAQWSSTNAAIVTVNAQGLVTVVGKGEADVLATYQGKMGGQTIKADLKPVVKPLLRGTTFQNLPIALATERRGPPIVDTLAAWAVRAQFTAADGRTATLDVENYGRADILPNDGSFRLTHGDGSFIEGRFSWDGSVSGTFQVSVTYQGVRYVVTGAYTARPSDT